MPLTLTFQALHSANLIFLCHCMLLQVVSAHKLARSYIMSRPWGTLSPRPAVHLSSRSRKNRKRTEKFKSRNFTGKEWGLPLCPIIQPDKSIGGKNGLAKANQSHRVGPPGQHPDFGREVLASKNTRQLFKYLVSEAPDINYSSPPHSAQIPGQVQL